MSGHAVYQVQTPVHDDGGGWGEDECVFIQVVHFTASLPRARQFNLTIIRSGRQIGFTGPSRLFDFYYKQASLGDYYCKRLAVVVAYFGHTCVNTVSQLHARVDIPIPLACGYRKDLAWEDQIPRCVCVMAVSIKMTGQSGESVNAPLTSVCVSMASFFPSSHHYINNWGKKRIKDSEALPLCVCYTPASRMWRGHLQQRVCEQNPDTAEIRSHTSSAN